MHHLLQPGWRRSAVHLLQRRRLAWRGSGRRDANGLQPRLLGDDFGDDGRVGRRGYRWRLGFDSAGAGACGHLGKVQYDVGRANVGDGVFLRVVLRSGGARSNSRGRGCGDHRKRRRWWQGRRWRWGRIHYFNRRLKRTVSNINKKFVIGMTFIDEFEFMLF